MKTYIRLATCFVALTFCELAYAWQRDSSLMLVVNPVAEIRCPIDKNAVGEQILYYKNRFPRAIYDCLHSCKAFDLRTQFDELIRLEKQIASDTREGFIKGIMDSIRYKPDAYLFASIDKATDKVIFRTEIIDLSSKPLAIASVRIGFKEFLDDDIVLQRIAELADSLCKQCTPPLPPDSSHKCRIKLGIGLGFGYRDGDQVTLGNVPIDLRMIPPHPEDVSDRLDQILDPAFPDNYFVRENTVSVDLGYRMSLDIYFSFWDIAYMVFRTSSINASEKSYDRNLLRRNYIKPGFWGDAFIYYSIVSKKRQFFDAKSFSIPVYFTYPVLYYGDSKDLVFRIMGGTNILLPEKIAFEAEQGWDRFGALEVRSKRDIGEIKETQWFGGLDIEGTPVVFFSLGIQFILVFTDYQENFNVPLSLQLDKSVHYSIRLTATKMFEW